MWTKISKHRRGLVGFGGEEDGYAHGKEDGVDIGDAKRLLHSVEILMKKMSYSVQEACESIGATMEEYDEALVRVGKRE